jgi:head-tail adaptor
MIGNRRHRVFFQNPGEPTPDGRGGYVEAWDDISPDLGWFVAIEPAGARDLERIAPGTVITAATYVIRGRFHPGLSAKSRMWHDGRVFAITGVRTIEEREIEMELAAVELETPPLELGTPAPGFHPRTP